MRKDEKKPLQIALQRLPWTVALLATEAGMSRAAFSSAFHRLVGRPPLDHVRAWRLTLARARLAAGASAASAASVAFEVGYTSQSAFGCAYKRFFRQPPGMRIEGSNAKKQGR